MIAFWQAIFIDLMALEVLAGAMLVGLVAYYFDW